MKLYKVGNEFIYADSKQAAVLASRSHQKAVAQYMAHVSTPCPKRDAKGHFLPKSVQQAWWAKEQKLHVAIEESTDVVVRRSHKNRG